MTRVACPQCSAVLKLRDDSLLGKPGKCPKCGHRFVLQETPVQVKTTSEPVPAAPRKPKSVRRVPETPTASAPVSETVSETTPTATALAAAQAGEFPGIAVEDSESAGTARLRELARKRARQRNRGMIVLGAIGVCVAGVIWAGMTFLPSVPARQVEDGNPPPTQDVEYLSQRDRLEQMATLIRRDSPTRGEPITLAYVPAGASIVVHLHPAELWKPGSPGEEVRFCLGKAFNSWLTSSITKYCGLPPEQIEEATICLILGARGTAPEVTAVVRPLEPMKTSELIQQFQGAPRKINRVDVYVGAERAAVMSRERDAEKRPLLYATAPASDAEGLAAVVARPGIASDAIKQMLETTDRDRHMTIVFQPADLEIHQQALFGSRFEPLITAFRDQFGENIEAAAWSMHFTGDEFVSELALRNEAKTTPMQMLETFAGKLDSLAGDLVEIVAGMNPSALGDRKLVGRLPAMVKLVDVSTVGGIDERTALLQARLPERAAPNLALAGLLTWHESTRTDAPPASPGQMKQTEQKSLAERLKTPIDIDFRRTPLEEAFLYIGEETGVTFEIDGDALKLSGYTRNMPQEFAMGEVPATEALARIVNDPKQDKLAVVLDEAKNVALVTTEPVAKQKGLAPVTLEGE